MRRAELLNVFFFTVFTALAWLLRLPLRRRITATRLGLAGIALSILPQLADTSQVISVLRDWLPAVQILLAYWQTGTFTAERTKGLEQKGGVGAARKPPVYMHAGDVFEVEIEGLGVLTNPVQDD
jgi:hypothetical protein